MPQNISNQQNNHELHVKDMTFYYLSRLWKRVTKL